MAFLKETNNWEAGIYQLETTDPVLAGPDGIDNLQGKQLANRTVYLKDQIDQLANGKQAAGNAAKLSAARNIAISGDGVWNVVFDGGKDVSGQLTLSNSGVTPGNYGQVTVDAKGRVTNARAIQTGDVPPLDWSKIASGKPSTLTGYGIADAAGADFVGPMSMNAYMPPGIYEYDPVGEGAPTSIPNHTVLSMGRVTRWTQLAIPYSQDQLFFRRNIDGNRGAWQEVWHSGNFRPELKADKATTLAGYGITDAASKDANNRSWASAFRASKGLPNGDESRTGFAFEADGDTGLFADGSGISGSSQLSLHIDSKKIFQVSNVGRMWTPAYGFFDESFSQKTETIRTLGQPTDKVDWNNLLDPGIYTVLDTTFGGLNAPPASYLWGSLQVMRSSPRGGAAGGVTQIYTAHGGMSVWFRTAWNDASWQPWQQLWHSGNLAFSGVLEGNGYQKLPSGLIIQWGQGSLNATLGNPSSFATALSTTGEVTFRTSFPSACCSIMVNGNENGVSGQTQEGYFWVGGRSKEKATIGYTQTFGSSTSERTAFDWFAIGY